MLGQIVFISSLLSVAYSKQVVAVDEEVVNEYENQFTKAGCTAVLVGRGATIDGSVITTHNNDCMECDFRIARTPAKSHPPGTMKNVYRYKADYPHMVNEDRSEVWHPHKLDAELVQKHYWESDEYRKSLILGSFPEVDTTYAIIEGVFGIMNEVGLGIGESTCAAIWFGKPPRTCAECEGPLVDIAYLSLIALERCPTARCAIETIGNLAETLGYYAVEQSKSEGGEALTIIDTKEAWMFHILPSRDGNGAIWVAQRVPDDHVAATANAFVIRDLDPSNPDLMYSSNIFEEAEQGGLWSSEDGELLDFAKVYGAVDKAYSEMITRRQWRVFDMVAPSLKLPAETDYLGDGLPFSVKVDKKISARDVMAIKRDYFKGTKFDLSRGAAAGPYGDPRRFDGSINRPWNENNLTIGEETTGGFERAISIMRTAYSTVLVSRETSPANSLSRAVVWVAQYAPHMSVYTPIYVAAGEDAVPEPLSIGSLWRFDNSSAYWRACTLGNWAAHFFRYTIKDVNQVQDALELAAFENQKVAEVQAQALIDSGDVEGARNVLAAFSINHCNDFVYAYNKLYEIMIAKFHDGYNLADPHALTTIDMRRLFYPKWWLKVAGYWTKFDKPIDYEPFPVGDLVPPPSMTPPVVTPNKQDEQVIEPVTPVAVTDPASMDATTDDIVSAGEGDTLLSSTQDDVLSHLSRSWLLISYILVSVAAGSFGFVMGNFKKHRNQSPVSSSPTEYERCATSSRSTKYYPSTAGERLAVNGPAQMSYQSHYTNSNGMTNNSSMKLSKYQPQTSEIKWNQENV